MDHDENTDILQTKGVITSKNKQMQSPHMRPCISSDRVFKHSGFNDSNQPFLGLVFPWVSLKSTKPETQTTWLGLTLLGDDEVGEALSRDAHNDRRYKQSSVSMASLTG